MPVSLAHYKAASQQCAGKIIHENVLTTK